MCDVAVMMFHTSSTVPSTVPSPVMLASAGISYARWSKAQPAGWLAGKPYLSWMSLATSLVTRVSEASRPCEESEWSMFRSRIVAG